MYNILTVYYTVDYAENLRLYHGIIYETGTRKISGILYRIAVHGKLLENLKIFLNNILTKWKIYVIILVSIRNNNTNNNADGGK